MFYFFAWKVIIFAICLVTVNTLNTTIDGFVGEWTPVALYTLFTYTPTCIKLSFSKNIKNVQCNCTDGKYTELLEARGVLNGKIIEEGKAAFPVLVTDDINEVTPSLNVSCDCGNRKFSKRNVMRSLSDDYFIMYRLKTFIDTDPNVALIYARELVYYDEIYNLMKNIEDLRERIGVVSCTRSNSECAYMENEILNTWQLSKHKYNAQHDHFLY